MKKEYKTTWIRIDKKTRDRLAKLARKDETWDKFFNRVADILEKREKQ
jgi:hypothetical protein